MAKEIFMPKLSSTMQTGTLLQWFKKEGESVEKGEPLFEIMTDKINIEVESYEEGTVLKQYYQADEDIPVNAVIGYIGGQGEAVPPEPPGKEGGTPAEEKNPAAEAEPSEEKESAAEPEAAAVKDNAPEPAGAAPEEPRKIRATPAARRMAKEMGVDLGAVAGSGPRGRIQRADVAAAAPKRKAEETETVSAAQPQLQETHGEERRVKLTGLRKTAGIRLQRNKNTAPHVTLVSEADMSEAITVRNQLLGTIEQQTGYRLSYTEIILKAAAHALKRHPDINVSLDGEEAVYHENVHIGLAVATERGLLVPVVKHADRKGLAALTADCKALSMAARENRLKPDQLTGGTFSVSNLGMYAVDAFTPVINLPESAILGVGRIQEKPTGKNGEIVLRPMMTLSLSFDHRIIDGAPAAAFLTTLKQMLEQPAELLV